MSIDLNSECVRSKYFTGQTDMDESLSDFQEVKKNCKGPRPAQQPVKPKPRKVIKRAKGQKDIRTALKGKKNELVSYTKEFDTVCKKSGLDVDSEELQLAIALSKSLQTESHNTENSPKLSTQQRVAKIRKTLQEYGFKVPEAKISVGKKIKKYRKHYKLLTVTNEEKHQIITAKYSQILFKNLNDSKLEQNGSQVSEARVFYIATNTSYNLLKDNNIFYVDHLVEKSETNGSLLRDWAEIPGRPESPKSIETNIMNFKDIDCSQDELDIILSGSLKPVKEILASKQMNYKRSDIPRVIIDDELAIENVERNTTPINETIDGYNEGGITEKKSPFQKAFNTSPVTVRHNIKSPVKRVIMAEIEIISPIKAAIVNSKPVEEIINVETTNKLTITQQYRSCSPDIFDDEVSSIMDNTKPTILSQEHKTKVFSQDFMDLTECANNIPIPNSQKSTQLSQNATKRKSNDFMEITKCIVGSSQPIRKEEIDLTQSPEENSINIDGNVDSVNTSVYYSESKLNTNDSSSQNVTDENQVTVLSNHEGKENVDLTQSSNEDDKGTTINKEMPEKKEPESMDLTQSSNSNDIDDLPYVNVGNSQSKASLDDTIIIDKDEYITNGKVKKSHILENVEVFDLTQAQNESVEYNSSPKLTNVSCRYSFYDDFVHDHDLLENVEENDYSSTPSKENSSCHNKSKESNEIDLTQGSDNSEERAVSPKLSTEVQIVRSISSLGKKDDISIDYDEILEAGNIDNDSFKGSKHADIETVDTNDIDINSSQNSDFNISDKELDYSLYQSRHDPPDNFDLGGISILDNLTKLGSFRKSLSEGCERSSVENKNDTFSDTLPEVNIRKVEDKPKEKYEEVSPVKVQDVLRSNTDIINVETPKNCGYIIKTHDVTPMADFEAMSTPERNKELNKYGLKPFKRKRAIQLLTHLYNQTHPTLQELFEDQPSPSKRQRIISYSQNSSSTKQLISPTKTYGSYIQTDELERDRDFFSALSPTKSPRTTPSKKTTDTTIHTTPSKTNELEWERNNLSAPSPKKSPRKTPLKKQQHETKHATPSKTHELKSDRDCLSAPSPKKTGQIHTDCGYEVTSEVAVLKAVDCNPEDWVFQKREKAKVHSCRVPLHIAFHNYVLSRRSLREAILKYEPVNIDVIHKDLVGYGHRYDPKDLLKFLDKKCITVKTADNNTRNSKR